MPGHGGQSTEHGAGSRSMTRELAFTRKKLDETNYELKCTGSAPIKNSTSFSLKYLLESNVCFCTREFILNVIRDRDTKFMKFLSEYIKHGSRVEFSDGFKQSLTFRLKCSFPQLSTTYNRFSPTRPTRSPPLVWCVFRFRSTVQSLSPEHSMDGYLWTVSFEFQLAYFIAAQLSYANLLCWLNLNNVASVCSGSGSGSSSFCCFLSPGSSRQIRIYIRCPCLCLVGCLKRWDVPYTMPAQSWTTSQ